MSRMTSEQERRETDETRPAARICKSKDARRPKEVGVQAIVKGNG